MQADIQNRWGIKLSKSTLKALCKKAKLSWKRVRKSLRGKRNDDKFTEAFEDINNLLTQADKGEIDFYCLAVQRISLISIQVLLKLKVQVIG